MDGFARVYVPWLLRRHFQAVHFLDVPHLPPQPVLVLSNHHSWWDPFFIIRANQRFFRKRYYVMMLERELRRRPLLRQAGAFSIQPGHPSVRQSLNYASSLLQHKGNLVQLFPSGRIEDPCAAAINFRGGAGYLLQRLDAAAAVCFSAGLIRYFNQPKPEAFVFFQVYSSTQRTLQEVSNGYAAFYAACLVRVARDFERRFR